MKSLQRILLLACVYIFLLLITPCEAFIPPERRPKALTRVQIPSCVLSSVAVRRASSNDDTEDNDKFGFVQRIDSLKSLVVGALAGGIAILPFVALHDVFFLPREVTTNGVAQWEFDNDMSSLEAGLFAIVYRYCIRQDENPQLNQGVVGAFVLTRTLSRIVVPSYCSAVPLNCGPPLGYFDWSMIGQGVANGAESVALFGAAAAAMDWCMRKGYISKFPG